MTRRIWTDESHPTSDPEKPCRVHRLREEGRRDHCVSLWLDGVEWFWTIWHLDDAAGGFTPSSHGRTPIPRKIDEVALPLEEAKRLAVEHAKRVGVIGQSDEVIG